MLLDNPLAKTLAPAGYVDSLTVEQVKSIAERELTQFRNYGTKVSPDSEMYIDDLIRYWGMVDCVSDRRTRGHRVSRRFDCVLRCVQARLLGRKNPINTSELSKDNYKKVVAYALVVLMPAQDIKKVIQEICGGTMSSVNDVKAVGAKFAVVPKSLANSRLRQLNITGS
jgi:hypothetical protein